MARGAARPPAPRGALAATVGLEVHVQLGTRTKLFCRCPALFGAPPNTLVCPVCTGQPGALPSLNGEALRLGALAGLALGCEIAGRTGFDRKSYFSPDLPKGYQITQVHRPLGRGGELRFEHPAGAERRVPIARLHLEEDAGKVLHPEGLAVSLVDLDRAGVPLLEIVTAPALHEPDEVEAALRELQRTLRYAGVSDCDMEKGGLRCDVNVSLAPPGAELGTRTEIKNLNSFRFVAAAVRAEIARQTALLESGEPVRAATLAFDAERDELRPLRDKEEPHDYRCVPDPDLPEYELPAAWLDALRAELPEPPRVRRARYGALGLGAGDVTALVADRALGDYFDATLAAAADGIPARVVAGWVVNPVRHLAQAHKRALGELTTGPARLAELIGLVHDGTVSSGAGRAILEELERAPDESAGQVAARLELVQLSNVEALEPLVRQVLAREHELVERYRDGRGGVLEALLGQVMQTSGGRANPQRVRELLARELGEPGERD